jgi:hypothetical protein
VLEYDSEGEEIAPPSGQLHPEWQHMLHLRGWNRMQVPFQAVHGTQEAPSYAFQDNERDGFFWRDGAHYGRDGLDRGEVVSLVGTPAAGQVPIWDATLGAYVPGTGGGMSASVDCVNDEAFTILAGQPVKPNGADGILLAQATSAANRSWGVAAESIASGDTGPVTLYGQVVRVDWSSVTTPSVATLTRGLRYFLAQGAAGLLTPTPPAGNGDVIQFQGTALDETTFLAGPFGRYLQL